MGENPGERLKKLREEKGLTQAVLAKEMGLARMTVVNYENGKSPLDSAFLQKASALFDCSADYLLCLVDDKNTNEERERRRNTELFMERLELMPQAARRDYVELFNRLMSAAGLADNLRGTVFDCGITGDDVTGTVNEYISLVDSMLGILREAEADMELPVKFMSILGVLSVCANDKTRFAGKIDSFFNGVVRKTQEIYEGTILDG